MRTQTLFVTFLLFTGTTLADVLPADDSQRYDEDVYPMTSSDYLRAEFKHHPGMVDDGVGASVSVLTAPDVDTMIFMLPVLGLNEAFRLVIQTNLRRIVRESSSQFFSMFVPSDKAIESWKQKVPKKMTQDQKALKRLCQAWVVPMGDASADFSDEMLLPTLSSDVKLRINMYDLKYQQAPKITVNGASIVSLRHIPGFSSIYVIDSMIFPLPVDNILESLSKAEEFSVLVNLVKDAGLEDFMNSRGALTVFAPVNQAFEQLPSAAMKNLAANNTKLQLLLKYHVIPDTYYSAGLADGQSLASSAGFKLRCNIEDGKYILNKDKSAAPARILYADMPATNGVIHVVDHVLLRPEIHLQ